MSSPSAIRSSTSSATRASASRRCCRARPRPTSGNSPAADGKTCRRRSSCRRKTWSTRRSPGSTRASGLRFRGSRTARSGTASKPHAARSRSALAIRSRRRATGLLQPQTQTKTMDKIKPLYTATATAIGGRNGHTETSDGVVKADLSLPKELGGPGRPGAATPEHLFAAGYAACFGGALDFVAKQQKRNAAKAKITSAVSIGPREGGGFGLAVKLRVEDQSIAQAELAAFVREAHEKICPYSHATRGNVDVAFEVVGS